MILGIDTSNYTTSVALWDAKEGVIYNGKQLLPVKEGEKGLRQSDAVFHHVRHLPALMDVFPVDGSAIEAIGVSVRPRDMDGSYMPCFTVGQSFAHSIGRLLHVPVYTFSHQAGHIAAALYSSQSLAWMKQRFLAFHFSGGTSELVLCEPCEETVFHTELISCSNDLKAGQVVDRVGLLLGLTFPCGPALDLMAQNATMHYNVRPTFRNGNPCLSGIENQCQKRLELGESKENVARFALDSICAVVDQMTSDARQKFGDLPVLYAGGVMANTLIRAAMEKKYGGRFAHPAFSSDNAAGVALLAGYRRNQLV